MKKILYIPDDRTLSRFNIFSVRHPLFYLLGLRGIISQHTEKEEKILNKYAKNAEILVEIGVAEGASAFLFRSVASSNGILYLIDPYKPGRIPYINLTKIIAHKYVDSCKSSCRVNWIESLSQDAFKSWSKPLDFLFIDADHSYQSCLRDWKDWNPFIRKRGYVVFHDARIFKNGWTSENSGPVRFINSLFRERNNSSWKIVEEVDSLVVLKRII